MSESHFVANRPRCFMFATFSEDAEHVHGYNKVELYLKKKSFVVHFFPDSRLCNIR